MNVDVGDNVRRVLERIERAARRAGRVPEEVALVAVSKTKPAALVDAAIAAGVRLIGENYVQEVRAKKPAVAGTASWHLIGRLQRNKARLALSLFDVVETVDSLELARVLDRLGRERGAPVRALVEVELGGEATKSGLPPAALPAFLERLGEMPDLRIEGLMAIPPPAAAGEGRHHFRRLRALREELRRNQPANVVLDELSMGMSDDFETAVEEGATLVRVGRAIFGARGEG